MEFYNENNVSKHVSENTVPVMSLRQYYLNVGSIIEDLYELENLYGNREANIGFTVAMIRDLIIRHADTTVEDFRDFVKLEED